MNRWHLHCFARPHCLPSPWSLRLRWLAGLMLAFLLAAQTQNTFAQVTVAQNTFAATAEPTNAAECRSTLLPIIETRCQQMFTDAGQKTACSQQAGSQVEKTCQQFFGAGQDFCATCTSSCTQNFAAGDGQRKQCLAMCLNQPGCQ